MRSCCGPLARKTAKLHGLVAESQTTLEVDDPALDVVEQNQIMKHGSNDISLHRQTQQEIKTIYTCCPLSIASLANTIHCATVATINSSANTPTHINAFMHLSRKSTHWQTAEQSLMYETMSSGVKVKKRVAPYLYTDTTIYEKQNAQTVPPHSNNLKSDTSKMSFALHSHTMTRRRNAHRPPLPETKKQQMCNKRTLPYCDTRMILRNKWWQTAFCELHKCANVHHLSAAPMIKSMAEEFRITSRKRLANATILRLRSPCWHGETSSPRQTACHSIPTCPNVMPSCKGNITDSKVPPIVPDSMHGCIKHNRPRGIAAEAPRESRSCQSHM